MFIKKYLLLVISLLILISVLQIFNIPGGNVLLSGSHKSDYFEKIDQKFEIAMDSFFGIKILTGFDEAFIFKDGLVSGNGDMTMNIFDRRGREIFAPGFKDSKVNRDILSFIREDEGSRDYFTMGDVYTLFRPVRAEKKCLICHRNVSEGSLMGVVKFTDKVDGKVFQGRERILIFTVLAFLLILLLILIYRWDTQKIIKEIFDKNI